MTPDNRKRRRINWSSAIGWIIFILIIAGRPIFRALQQILGSNINLPTNLSTLIPIAIGGLVVLSIVVSALRALGNANRASTRLPTELGQPGWPQGAPMPPFGRTPGAGNMPAPRAFTPPTSGAQQRLPTPRFEPVINPTILAIGILGLLALGGAALFFFVQGGP